MKRKTSSAPKTGVLTLLTAQTALLCAVVFLSPLIAGRLTAIPSLSMQALVLTAAVVWMVRSHREGAVVLPGRWISGLILALAACLLLSAWKSASLYLTIRELLNFASYLLVFLMAMSLAAHRKALYAIIGSLCISALIVGLQGVKEYILTGGGGWRVFSTFFNPDFLAGFAALMLPVALGWYLSRTSFAVSLVSWLSVLYLTAAALMTGSRFGALCAVIGVVIFCVLVIVSGNARRVRFVRVFLLILPMIAVYKVLSLPLTARVASTKAESHSGGFRICTWKGAADMALANPIHGAGLGTFTVSYPKYAIVGFTRLAHNTYLQIAAEAGIPASVLLALLLASASLGPIGVLIRRKLVDDGESGWMPETGLMLSGLLGGAAASMARNVVDSDWYVTAIGLSFWVVLGAGVAVSGSGIRSIHLSRKAAGGAVASLVLLIIGTGSILTGESMSALAEVSGPQNPESAMRFYRLAAKFEPLNADYHRRIAGFYPYMAQVLPEGDTQDSAIKEITQAISLEPGNGKNYYQLARLMGYYRKPKEAIAAYEKALTCNPNAVEVMLRLARAYEGVGQGTDALRVWRRMVSVENSPYEQTKAVPELVAPEYIFAHEALGAQAELDGDKTAAVREYRSALSRISRYHASIDAMKAVLDANNRRNPEMESAVDAVQTRLQLRLKQLPAQP